MQNFGDSAGPLGLKHCQIPFTANVIEAEDIEVSVIAFDLEISVVAPMPPIHVLDDLNGASAEIESSDHVRAGMAGIGLNLEIHREP